MKENLGDFLTEEEARKKVQIAANHWIKNVDVMLELK